LGLAICRKIVEALDGQIRFETRDNEGTDFFVEFPITFEEAAEPVPAVQLV
jgi:signal transduction histidine kinase